MFFSSSFLFLSCKSNDSTPEKTVNELSTVNPENKDGLIKSELKSDSLKISLGDSIPESNTKANTTLKTEKKKHDDKIVVYYFHPTARCSTCINIENYTKEAVDTKFKKEKKDGLLRFKELNIEEDENEHYINDYNLTSSSVIIVHYKNGKQKNWKNLENVWSFEKNKEQFLTYIKIELNEFLKSIKEEGHNDY
jgi:hypothetical protein